MEPSDVEESDASDESEETLEGSSRPAARRPARRLYGPFSALGAHIRVQAEKGYRAGGIELRPGLWLVAEVPERALRQEFGAALLAPLAIQAASMALANPEQTAQLVSSAAQGVQTLTSQLFQPQHAPVAGWLEYGAPLPSPRLLPPPPPPPALRWVEPQPADFGCDGYPQGQCPCTRRYR